MRIKLQGFHDIDQIWDRFYLQDINFLENKKNQNATSPNEVLPYSLHFRANFFQSKLPNTAQMGVFYRHVRAVISCFNGLAQFSVGIAERFSCQNFCIEAINTKEVIVFFLVGNVFGYLQLG